MNAKFVSLILTAGVLVLAAGCQRSAQPDQAQAPSPKKPGEAPGATPGAANPTYTFSTFPVPEKPALTPELVAHGKEVYSANCAACHGEKGDGHGKCAGDLLPRPRDFTEAHFRLRSTPSGSLPTDADLFRSVSLGLKGTPMPPWKFLLSDNDRWAVVEYIKTFSPRFEEAKENRAQPVDLGAPPARNAEAIAAGQELYAKMSCAQCHGKGGQGDGPSSNTLTDESGQHISARDFSKPSGFKAGYATREIVRDFLTGFDGTPMPSFDGIMSKQEAWELAYYVETLVKEPVVPVARRSQNFLAQAEELGPPDVKIQLSERGWKYEPSELHVKKGQVVEITFEPTDNGLGAGHGFSISSYDEVAFINGAMVGVPKTVKFRADRAGKFTYYCSTQCSVGQLHPLMNGTLYVEDTPSTETASLR